MLLPSGARQRLLSLRGAKPRGNPMDRDYLLKHVAAHKGRLVKWYPATYTADVDLLGHFKASIKGIKVSRSIPSSEMVVGRYVEVAIFNPTRPLDGLVVGVYT